jgi:FlaA1/EpsC-like NDP-sugar epimerase
MLFNNNVRQASGILHSQWYLKLVGQFLRVRFWVLVFAHVAIFSCAYIIALGLRFDFRIPEFYWKSIPHALLAIVTTKLVVFYAFRSFHGWWRYVAFSDLNSLIRATLVAFVSLTVIDHFALDFQIPRSVLIVDSLLSLSLIGLIRSSWRLLNEEIRPLIARDHLRNTLIVGTSENAVRLAHQLRAMPKPVHKIVGLISRTDRAGQWLSTFPILGTIEQIDLIFSCCHIDDVVVPDGELPGSDMRRLVDIVKKRNGELRVIPCVSALVCGSQRIPLREVNINDLLGRDPVVLDNVRIASNIEDKVVLVTGAGGSIGSEICRQVLAFKPRKLVLLGRGENRIFEIERELKALPRTTELVPIIADINDYQRLREVFKTFQPDVVFHAAAHKHVPLMEANPSEAIKNNILGTRNTVDCAHAFQTKHFVMISTDKAVNPTSVMGASKHVAERYVLSRSDESSTKFVVVRFGNVLGSNGSVVPVFQDQIRRGGPITITDPRMKRFFMSIPEASQLVLQAAAQGNGGEIFVLDMGEPVLVVDLARDLIRLSGLDSDAIEIAFTGTRPGEKLYEELYFDEETSLTTDHQKIFAAYHRPFSYEDVAISIEKLAELADRNASAEEILEGLGDIIPEFKHASFERSKKTSSNDSELIETA